ncbi:MAG: DUF4062 domain-containing protein [Pseudomonadota bacterium]
MDKRFQVFISSTFQDLKNARQEVSEALLRADCFPAGMELFPAADEEQFEFIKTIIEQSDYYIIISAGRYGSIHPKTGLSYTEMEYDFAKEIGKPIIRLLHKNPFKELKGEFIEDSDIGKEKLNNFREKMQKSSLVRFWEIPKELGIEVLVSLQDLKRRNNAIGWVRADSALEPTEIVEVKKLENQINKLLKEKENLETKIESLEKVEVVENEDFPFELPKPPFELHKTQQYLKAAKIENPKYVLALGISQILKLVSADSSEFYIPRFNEFASEKLKLSSGKANGIRLALRQDRFLKSSGDGGSFESVLATKDKWAAWVNEYLDVLSALNDSDG